MPRVNRVKEVVELSEAQQATLWREVAAAERVVQVGGRGRVPQGAALATKRARKGACMQTPAGPSLPHTEARCLALADTVPTV